MIIIQPNNQFSLLSNMKRKKCSWWHQWPLLPTFCIFNDDASAKKSTVMRYTHFQSCQFPTINIVYSSRRKPTNCISVKNMLLPVILLMFFIVRPVLGLQKVHGPLNITAVTGITVELKCKVKLHECGNFNG